MYIVFSKILKKNIDVSCRINEFDDDKEKLLSIQRASRMPKKPIYQMYFKESLKKGQQYELEIDFSGSIWETTDGLFKGQYLDGNGNKMYYLATHMRPNNARRLFPCFDEPGFKVPFTVSISRPKDYATLFNMLVESTSEKM